MFAWTCYRVPRLANSMVVSSIHRTAVSTALACLIITGPIELGLMRTGLGQDVPKAQVISNNARQFGDSGMPPSQNSLPAPSDMSPVMPAGYMVPQTVISNQTTNMRVKDLSLIYVEPPPPPPQIKVHDIVTVEVDEKSEAIINSRFNRQRNGAFKAQLKDFIRLSADGPTLTAAASATDPSIDAVLQNRLQTLGTATDQEGITYKIAATVVDVLPNGTIVLEARKSIGSAQDVFVYRLSGRVDKAKITAKRTVRSEDIAELDIERSPKGRIFDSTKTGWGTRILDVIWPF